jgi:Pvc16 N-terminal domain
MLRGSVANFRCISATGKTIERLLNACFLEEQPISDELPTRAVLVRSDDFARPNDAGEIPSRALAVFLYRIEVNKVMRAAWSGVGSFDGQSHLPIDLHFLLIAFGDNAEFEQQILGRAMQCLECTPSLSGPLLYPTADWAPNEAVHLMVEDLGIDSVMRTFDSLAVDYRLCVPYLARIVRIDGRLVAPPPSTSTVIAGLAPLGAA